MFSLGCARLGLIFYLFLFGFCRANFFSFCRSCRDGNFLACPLPWLCFRPAGRLSLFARPVLPEPARRALCVRSSVLFWLSVCLFYVVCTRIFLLSFAFSCLAVASQTSFHLSLRPRRASTFFRKESRQRFAKGLGPFEPPFLRPAAVLSFFRAAGRLSGPSAANRRLAGKRLKSPGAELSFSSVSVRRGTPVPCGRSPFFPRCWPA